MRIPVLFRILTLAGLIAASPAPAAVCDGISTASHAPLTTVRIVSGLTRPVLVTAPTGDVDRLFLVEQDGRIKIRKNGAVLAASFLDINTIVRSPADLGGGDEEGLLGLAFHPDYATNGWFFVYYTNTSSNNVVARYTVSGADPDLADTASRQEVLVFNHPSQSNHNGGMIAFGPNDGHLYIGTGDGGGFCDLSGNAQNGNSPLGKLHRIDVDALPYSIPAGNPFVGNPSFLDEIWAYGLRNPWRWSFDRANGDLYIGDVGQGQWEEVDWRAGTSVGGENYGWRNYEGNVCPNPSCGNVGTCTPAAYVGPVEVYTHGTPLPGEPSGCSITGGYAYRGCRMPGLAPTYFYADHCTNVIRSFKMVAGAATERTSRTTELAPLGGFTINSITSFGEDARGEMYLVDRGGEVFKIVPILPNLEVSGSGAAPFLLSRNGDWTWEDLPRSSDHPIATYRIYRSNGNGSGTFDCIRQQAGTVWGAGGDPSTPSAGGLFAYLVTAISPFGPVSSAGTGTGGTPRALSGAACP